MVEDERYCIDVVTQINAVRAALHKIALGLVDDHVRHCLKDPRRADEHADELMDAVGRMLSLEQQPKYGPVGSFQPRLGWTTCRTLSPSS